MRKVLIAVEKLDEVTILTEKMLDALSAEKLKLWLVHVAEPDPDFVGFEAGPQSERDRVAQNRRTFRRMLDETAEKLRSMEIAAESMMISGPTVQTILDKANELNADLIVLGHRKHGLVYETVLGSTTKSVIDKTDRPVLLIPLNK
jgi:nucleotide-binding universal stress UspA family protein